MNMRAFGRWLAMALLACAVAVAGTVPAYAASTSLTIGEAIVDEGETHTGDLTVTIGEAIINGHVTGEVRNNLGAIVIRGTVGRHAVSSVGEIRVEHSGQVGGDVRTSAGQITVRGDVGGNVISTAGEIVVRGRVGGDVEQEAGEVRISGEVAGDVRVRKGVVHLLDGAVVRGGVYVDEGWVERSSGATANTISVRVERRDFDDVFIPAWNWFDWSDYAHMPMFGVRQWFQFNGFMRFGRAVVLMIVGLAALALFPQRMQRMAEHASEQPGRSLGFGALGLVLMPVVVVLLIISILGIIVLPFAIIAMALLWLIGQLVAGYALGRAIAARLTGPDQKPWHEFAEIGLGVFVLVIIGYVPIVGWLASAAAALIGFGAVLSSRFGRPADPSTPSA